MKPTTTSSKSYSGACVLSHTGVARGTASAHTPRRHQTAPARLLDPAPRLTASGHHLGYVEAPHGKRADWPGGSAGLRRVLHVDPDRDGALVLACLLAPEAYVTHAATLDEAVRLLEANVFSLVVLDPGLPDGDARVLLPMLSGTPLLVYAAHQPEWGNALAMYLPKPWTSPRQLWVAISALLGLPDSFAAGD